MMSKITKRSIAGWKVWMSAACILPFSLMNVQLLAEPAFKINGKPYQVEDLAKEHQGKFFEIEQKRYELIADMAREKFLEEFWQGGMAGRPIF